MTLLTSAEFVHTPLDVAPLHPFKADWACDKPERPWYEGLRHDFRCRSCWLHAKATVLNGLDPEKHCENYSTGDQWVGPLSERVEANARLFEDPSSGGNGGPT